jgi:hypothetical protein
MSRPTRAYYRSSGSAGSSRRRERRRLSNYTPLVSHRLSTLPRQAAPRRRILAGECIQKDGVDGVGDQPIVTTKD